MARRQVGEEEHLGEELIHRYLDGELDAGERAAAAAHLAACPDCRAEVAALRRLFFALDELAPTPNLVPAVRARLARDRQPAPAASWRRWLAPALQMATVLALLAWGATRPPTYWPAVAGTMGSMLQRLWEGVSAWTSGWVAGLPAWAAALPRALSSWPGEAWAAACHWTSQLGGWGRGSLSALQIVVGGAILVGVGVVGNLVLLRRAALNGHTAR